MNDGITARGLSGSHKSEQTTTMFPDLLTFFAILWAFQELFHMLYFSYKWSDQTNPLAWAVILFALATLLFPRSLLLFGAMLTSSILYNIDDMPFVVNHILIEVTLSITILLSIITAAISRYRSGGVDNKQWRDGIFYRFAPIIGGVLILLYHIIFISKLNWDFYDPDLTCIGPLYADAQDRMAFLFDLPSGRNVIIVAYWIFMFVELLLPVLLGFKKTAYSMFFFGLPFHFMLGLIGYWTFSGFVIVTYAVIAFPSIIVLLNDVKKKLGSTNTNRLKRAIQALIVSIALLIFVAKVTGNYEGKGPFFIDFRFTYALWAGWYLAFSVVIFAAIFRQYKLRDSEPLSLWSSAPKWLWVFYGLVVVNGMSPYLGFKTETSVAMYSNMQTEGGKNNHMFMPALRLLPDNDRLVDIIESNDPKINSMKTAIYWRDRTETKRPIYNTYFEFRRAVSESTNPDLRITYSMEGKDYTYIRGDSNNADPELDKPHSWIVGKLIFFRPIFQGKSYCLH